MRALDRKLLRDFRRLWAQALAIALVLACGVAVILMSFGMSAALDETREAYYERNRFADVFVQARRAPRSLLPEIAAIPGVASVEARISGHAILDVPGRTEAAVGQILSLPEFGAPRLNTPLLRAGTWPNPDSTDDVVVNEPFAEANGFRVGDTFQATLDGRKRQLRITGTALSPEFVYTIGPGALMPDDTRFGILWMSDAAVAAAYDMQGAFNDLALALVPGAAAQPVIDRLDETLRPYGGLGAYGRDLQLSNSFVESEIDGLRVMAYILPPVFLGITVFLVNMVMSRIVALERGEIGLLKALGYSNAEISLHYVLLSGLIAVAGVLIGWAAGALLARGMAALYARFYDFPYLIFRMPGEVYVLSGLLALAAATLGAIRSALSAARLPPAVAMSPPAPPRYRRNLLDRGLAAARLSQPTMMIVRSLVRWPVRALLTTLGLALATSILVSSGFFSDATDEMIGTIFDQSNRQDVMLVLSDDLPRAAVEEVRRLPGVLRAEPQLYHAAILRHGHREKRTAVEARDPDADLSRVVDDAGRAVTPEPGSVHLSRRLARHLDVGAGDTVTIEFLAGRRETVEVPVGGIVTQFIGLGAYMDLDSLNALHRTAPRVSTVNLALDEAETEAFHRAIKEIPRISAAVFMTVNRRSFVDTIQQNMLVTATVYGALGVLITFGVAYNGARVQLSERARELASLRILGFSRAEVSYVLIGETLILALLAQPLGWWIGVGVARLFTQAFSSDLYEIPLVIEPSTFTQASLVVLGATAVSLLLVRRRLDGLDLVAVMKTRE
jgi:putative ABC transport system permease protein